MKKNLIVGQSGGPTAVINGSLYGVVSEALACDEIGEVYGMQNGIEGFLLDRIMPMAPLAEDGTLEIVRTTPGAFLGSCRYKLPEDENDPVYDTLFRKMDEKNIGYFLYIGGNDSMDTAAKLSKQAAKRGSDIRFIGVPKTIDNDLCVTDHTPGYGSAARFVAQAVREIAIDASVYDTKESVTIIEIMGRHAGWLTAASRLAQVKEDESPVLIYLPEADFDQDAFLAKIQEMLKVKKNLIVCISEGIHDKEGTFICEYDSSAGVDNFGHKMLSGSGKYLENLVKNSLGIKARSVELNVLQRCAADALSACDLREAIECGRTGVKLALAGMTGQMVAIIRNEGEGYSASFEAVDVSLVCNEEKKFPAEWIINDGSGISEEFLAYAKPLIDGNVELPYENGLPKFAYRS